MNTSTDTIEREILIKASRSRVWRALTDAGEFGEWFGAAIAGQSFAVGGRVLGHSTYPGYEHMVFDITVERLEPEQLFSYRWHPYPADPAIDYSKEPTTLVVFELKEVAAGTLLSVVESGFDRIPAARRLEAFRMHSEGWEGQLESIEKYVAAP
ncbi:vanillate O-demethylase oxidoreductase VanB [Oryzomonas japonica]|uniref:Vanillate O-demethylase oxidoreductase VanB n=1 Tax=Oryzomonas japonica TaxID=2603858 RepID=A0A7J4ZMQ7_9BACT|nr:SRPBCC family protein [Oryzomonas japonica]KAB0664037.1 vanillate O-demethylase oxidoreductase VanB [Oryzomonas japonica]